LQDTAASSTAVHTIHLAAAAVANPAAARFTALPSHLLLQLPVTILSCCIT
jgi:hypothetical protein